MVMQRAIMCIVQGALGRSGPETTWHLLPRRYKFCSYVHLRLVLTKFASLRRLLAIICALGFFDGLAQARSTVASVVVVANQSDPDSVSLAQYYMDKRGIPAVNLVKVEAPTEEAINWKTYVGTIHNPLLKTFVKNGWIDAVPTKLKDDNGRFRYGIVGHSISFLVVCRGLPLKIRNDPARIKESDDQNLDNRFQTNRSSVDSELSLLPISPYPITGWIPNPLFLKKNFSLADNQKVLKVSRLDGPTLSSAKALVDNALRAEKEGLMGRAYVDNGGAHEIGNEWLSDLSGELLKSGFDLQIEHTQQVFGPEDRFDAPALYFGWYSRNITGPFLNPGFHFPPGAIAAHIHSFSASTLSDSSRYWCGPLVMRGATATFGNVWEPYLRFTHHPNEFFKALAEGRNFGDAAYYALPALSWQAVLIGDPLYQPFKVSLDQQLDNLDADNLPLGQYAVIRKMRLLRAEGGFAESLSQGLKGFRKSPGVALGLELGKAYLSSGEVAKALETLRFAIYIHYYSSNDWLPAKEIADLLVQNGDVASGLQVYKNLILSKGLPGPLLKRFLYDGAQTAKLNGDHHLAAEWNALLK